MSIFLIRFLKVGRNNFFSLIITEKDFNKVFKDFCEMFAETMKMFLRENFSQKWGETQKGPFYMGKFKPKRTEKAVLKRFNGFL